jgi:signal transduction histidine kinase
VSKGFAETHGGTLTLDSSVKHGARFVLRLPRADERVLEDTATHR